MKTISTTDLSGDRFGLLIVRKKLGKDKWRQFTWSCDCDCGNHVVLSTSALKYGGYKSCGCLSKQWRNNGFGKLKRTHGESRTPTYKTWYGMISRCYHKDSISYPNYGARGITVCDRWRKSFEDFVSDMGRRPEGKTLDRINTYGNYEPSNCRWATIEEQSENKRLRKSIEDWTIQELLDELKRRGYKSDNYKP